MAVISGSAALLKAAATVLKLISKSGIRKGAMFAAKKVAKSGVVKKAVLKKKAKDFLSRKKKRGRKGVEQQEKGGSLVLRDKRSSSAAKFVGGKKTKDSSTVATVAPDSGKMSFGAINEQIDNIVGLTASIDAIVKSQYKEKKDEIKELRKDRQDRRKRAREAFLESKKVGKKSGSGTEGAKDKKGDPLGWLTAILIGTAVLGLINAISALKKVMDTLGLNLHQVWVIIRYVPKALMNAFGKALKFIKNKGGKLLQGIKNKFGKVFKGAKDKVVKGFQKIAQGIKSLAQGLWKRIVNIADDLLKAGPQVMARMGQAFKAVGQVVGGGIRRATVGARRFIGRSGRQFLKSTASNINKVKNIAIKGFRSIKNSAIKGFNALKGIAAKGITRLRALARLRRMNQLKDLGKTGSQILKGGVGRSASRMLIKIFGPNIAKAIVRSPLIKTLSGAAKAMPPIPVIGPLIVAVTSLMSGDNIEKTMFKALGTAIGGMIGLGLGPLGAIVGELLGESIGELIYVAFRDPAGGKDAAVALLKQKWQNILKTGTKIKDWMSGGFSRFWGWFKLEHPGLFGQPNYAQLLNPLATAPLLVKGFFNSEVPPNPKDIPKFDENKDYKVGDRVMKEGRMRYWDGEKWTYDNPLVNTNTSTNNVNGVDRLASYEDGAEEEIVVPLPGGTGGDSSTPIVVTRTTVEVGSNTRSAIDTMQKENHLAALY